MVIDTGSLNENERIQVAGGVNLKKTLYYFLTRENKINQDNVFPLFGIAYLVEEGIQNNEDNTGQES